MNEITKRILLLFLCVFLLSCNKRQIMDNQISDNKERVADYLDRLLSTSKDYPGLQYVVFNKDGIIFEYAGGFADIKNKIKMTSDHTMNVFSTTKLITAIAILQLSENKRINLNDNLEKYITDIPYKNVTVNQVLSHTGGIPNPVLGNFYVHWSNEHIYFDSDKLLFNAMNANKNLKFKPGKDWSYSNLGFAILGKIIETVSGREYEDYIKENIFDILQLDQNRINFSDRNHSNSAKPYFMKNSLFYNVMVLFLKGADIQIEKNYKTLENAWYFDFPSHGGIISSSKEYSKIFIDLLNEDSKVLSKPMKELFFKEQFTNSKQSMAISWFINNLNGMRYYWHQGGGLGYIAEVRIYRDKNIGTILLINQTDSSLLRILDDIDLEFIE
jgi:D-alanyl-D-alanine carboxypeptidase